MGGDNGWEPLELDPCNFDGPDQHPRISCPWGSRRIAPSQGFSTNCEPGVCLACLFGQSRTSFTLEGGIGLQNARYTISPLANTRETHDTMVFAGFWNTPSPCPDFKTLVLPMLTQNPFSFHGRVPEYLNILMYLPVYDFGVLWN